MICFSLSTEHGPAMTMNSSPPISVPFTTNPRFPRSEFAADELVRSRNADRFFHLRHGFQRFQTGGDIANADHADHDALFAFYRMHFVAEIANTFADRLDSPPSSHVVSSK